MLLLIDVYVFIIDNPNLLITPTAAVMTDFPKMQGH